MSSDEIIWRFLWEQLGNPYGVAGLMGNLQAESGLRPDNLQNSYEKKLGMTDAEYTKAVDDLKYQKDDFIHDGAGYGLAQWTFWSRKRDLYEFAENRGASIGDLSMQLDFLVTELARYTAVFKVLLNAASVREASDAVLLKYEKPADQSEANCERRAALGQAFYDRFTAETGAGAAETQRAGEFSTEEKSPPEAAETAITGVVLNPKVQACVDLAKSKLGDPYVFGTWGQPCTPDIRKRYAGYRPQYKDKIYGACPVLSHKQTACAGCKWEGRLCYDCRGFTHYVFENGAGIDLYGEGCTTQFETAGNWAERGKTADMPNVVCCLFKYDQEKKNYSHTGMHIGNGVIIHCTGNGGVKYGSITDKTWTHYAIPKGLYTREEIEQARGGKTMRTLRKGYTGMEVEELQERLNAMGFKCGVPDGIFGSKTETAVRAFQSAYGLKADGIVGDLTWAALEKAEGKDTKPEPAEDFVRIPRDLAQKLYDVLGEQLVIDARSGNISNIDCQ